MPDNLSPEDRRRAMQSVKSKGTSLERILWSMLAGMRIKGWRKNVDEISGKPDVVFDKERIAIFVDGCFWHGCPICNRKIPETNQEYWRRKIERNKRRAREVLRMLEEEGWIVLRFWEHELRGSRQSVRERVRAALQSRQRQKIG